MGKKRVVSDGGQGTGGLAAGVQKYYCQVIMVTAHPLSGLQTNYTEFFQLPTYCPSLFEVSHIAAILVAKVGLV